MKSFIQLSKSWYGNCHLKLFPDKIDDLIINKDLG
jgi:hypothetical protein